MSWMIKIEDVSKMYRLGLVSSGTLQDDFKRAWYKLKGKEDPFLKIGEENKRDTSGGDYVWALNDINFEVEKGEILGIIGKNGAGKSTLLKLLSKVTKPSTGSIKTRGRIASLLEVGTGFHPELTGRENIFLNGAILGMKKPEIKSKFDEIVSFSGCERYIDTPVKRYSSGMHVRLAFAVAAHLEPEILVVDEVLAVGDAEFQKKAIGKMKDISQGNGRTVLFVSHNMGSIRSLCSKVLLMNNGKIQKIGEPEEIIKNYLNSSSQLNLDYNNRKGSQILKVNNINVLNSENNITDSIFCGEQMKILISISCEDYYIGKKMLIMINIKNNSDNLIYQYRSDEIAPSLIINQKKEVYLELPKCNFRPSNYFISVRLSMNSFSSEDICDHLDNCQSFNVLTSDFYNVGKTIKQGSFGLSEASYSSI